MTRSSDSAERAGDGAAATPASRVRQRGDTTDQESTSTPAQQQSTSDDTCPECDGTLITDDGESICADCGLVVSVDRLDRTPQWPTDKDGKLDLQRGSGRTHVRHDNGLGTSLNTEQTDARGNALTARQQTRIRRLAARERQYKPTNHEDRARYAHGEIKRMASACGLPSTARELSGRLFTQLHDDGFCRGFAFEAVATACLYVACQAISAPRTIDELHAVSRIDNRKRIARRIRDVKREVSIEVGPTDPSELVPRFASQLNLDAETETVALTLISKGQDTQTHLAGSPQSLAAGALFLAALYMDADVTKRDVADACDTSLRTTRKYAATFEEIASLAVLTDG